MVTVTVFAEKKVYWIRNIVSLKRFPDFNSHFCEKDDNDDGDDNNNNNNNEKKYNSKVNNTNDDNDNDLESK